MGVASTKRRGAGKGENSHPLCVRVSADDDSEIRAIGGGLVTRMTNIPTAAAAAEEGGRLVRSFISESRFKLFVKID